MKKEIKRESYVKIIAVVLTVVLLCGMLLLPMSGAITINKNSIFLRKFNQDHLEKYEFKLLDNKPENNLPARSLYESVKMNVSSRETAYYDTEDAIIYSIEL